MFTRGYVVFKMFDPSATGTTWPHRSQLLKAPTRDWGESYRLAEKCFGSCGNKKHIGLVWGNDG